MRLMQLQRIENVKQPLSCSIARILDLYSYNEVEQPPRASILLPQELQDRTVILTSLSFSVSKQGMKAEFIAGVKITMWLFKMRSIGIQNLANKTETNVDCPVWISFYEYFNK